MTFTSIRKTWYSRLISVCLIVTFAVTMVITPRASYASEGVLGLPQPGTMVNLSSAFVPLMITGLRVHPENPLLMDFIVSTGNSNLNDDQVKKESDRLIKYFLACLTIPDNDQWVNLSPYEKQRIIPEDLGQTVLGQDMLAQDYLLKQLTASLIYPEKNLGKDFWDKVYTKASQMYGTTQIPINTFNKVWILPDSAEVYEHTDTVLVLKSHLKVMLDEDYLALGKNTSLRGAEGDAAISKGITNSGVNNLGSQIVRQIILPAIEQEVNKGKNFAQLRQIYNSMILAVWFKNNLKQAFLNQVYTGKSKVNGVNTDDPAIKDKIFKQYLQAYKKGVFNYIKEEVDQNSQQMVPRKYFSGGLVEPSAAMMTRIGEQRAMEDLGTEPAENKFLLLHSSASGVPNTTGFSAAMQTEPLDLVHQEAISKIIFPALQAFGLTLTPPVKPSVMMDEYYKWLEDEDPQRVFMEDTVVEPRKPYFGPMEEIFRKGYHRVERGGLAETRQASFLPRGITFKLKDPSIVNEILGIVRSLDHAMIYHDQAREKLAEAGWGDLFDQWWNLLNDRFQGQEQLLRQKQDRLLSQIEDIDWNVAKRLRDEVIVPGVPKPEVPKEFEVPVEKIGAGDEQEVRQLARTEVLEAGATDAQQSKFAVVLAAGGTGSEFRSDNPKGYLLGTPLSQIPLYAGMVKKIQAAAKYYGHKKSFPIIVMTSDITHTKTVEFFKENQWFGMQDRIYFAQQGVMPLFDAKTSEPFLNAKGELATGGTGHGDTFDDILVRPDVVDFMDKFGVEVVQYIAVDNQLNPIADERLIGYGQKTWDPNSKDARAHIALGVIKKKDRNDRLANQVFDLAKDEWVTIGYGDATEQIKDAVDMGDPSFRVVWRQSLINSKQTPWRIDTKPQLDFEGNLRTVKKIEHASDNKPRRNEGPLVELNRDDTFEPIKKPDALATTETLATSYLAQSNYWKKRLAAVGVPTTNKIAVEIAAQEAFYMSDDELNAKLEQQGIKSKITDWLNDPSRKSYELGGVLITENKDNPDNWEVQFIGKNDDRLYFLNWQKEMIDSPVAPNVDPNIHQGKTVMITGGAGYVASGVLYELLQNGSNVVIYDNMITPSRKKLLDKIIAAYPGRVTVIQGNLASRDLLVKAMRDYKVDSVVHLAAYIAAGVSVDLPATYYENNVVGTLNVLDAMKEANVKNLSFASSAGVFEGKRKTNKFGLLDEKTPVNPQGPYGETKYLMEVLMQAYAKEHGINYSALRFFNLAGAFYWDEIKTWVGEGHLGPETHMIPRLVKYFLYGKEKVPFQIYGKDYPTPDGTNIRDYIHVRDIGHAIMKSLSLSYQAQNEGRNVHEAFTLGTGTATSNKQIVDSFKGLLPQEDQDKFVIDYGPRRNANEPAVLRASSENATRILAWRGTRPLVEILKSAFEYHKQEQKDGSLNLQEPFPERMTGFSESEYRKEVLDGIMANPTLKAAKEVQAEIILRLLTRSISYEAEGIKNGFKGNRGILKGLFENIAEKEGGLFDLISTEGFVSAVSQKRELVSDLIKDVSDETGAKSFGDDPNDSRLHIAQALESLINELPQTKSAAMTVLPPFTAKISSWENVNRRVDVSYSVANLDLSDLNVTRFLRNSLDIKTGIQKAQMIYWSAIDGSKQPLFFSVVDADFNLYSFWADPQIFNREVLQREVPIALQTISELHNLYWAGPVLGGKDMQTMQVLGYITKIKSKKNELNLVFELNEAMTTAAPEKFAELVEKGRIKDGDRIQWQRVGESKKTARFKNLLGVPAMGFFVYGSKDPILFRYLDGPLSFRSTANPAMNAEIALQSFLHVPVDGNEGIPFNDLPNLQAFEHGTNSYYFWDKTETLEPYQKPRFGLFLIDNKLTMNVDKNIPDGHFLWSVLPELRQALIHFAQQHGLIYFDRIVKGYDEDSLRNTFAQAVQTAAYEIWGEDTIKDEAPQMTDEHIAWMSRDIELSQVTTRAEYRKTMIRFWNNVGGIGSMGEKIRFYDAVAKKLVDNKILPATVLSPAMTAEEQIKGMLQGLKGLYGNDLRSALEAYSNYSGDPEFLPSKFHLMRDLISEGYVYTQDATGSDILHGLNPHQIDPDDFVGSKGNVVGQLIDELNRTTPLGDEGSQAMAINTKDPKSQDVVSAMEATRFFGYRKSFFDANAGKFGSYLHHIPLVQGTGIQFYLISKLGPGQSFNDDYANFQALEVFLGKLQIFLTGKFPSKRVTIEKKFYHDSGTSEAKVILTDRAQASNPLNPEGGIDLNSKNLNLQSEGQKVNIAFDAAMVAQFRRGDFSGVKIKILDVEPINLMPLLGLKEDSELALR